MAAWLGLLLATIALSAHAMSLRELRALAASDKKHGNDYVNYYLVGAMEGVIEAHSQDVRAGVAARICVQGRKLEPAMARSLYEQELQRNDGVYEADMPVQLVMRNALETVYPC